MSVKKTMIYDHDEWLVPYKEAIDKRHEMIASTRDRLSVDGSLSKAMNNHMYYGLHRDGKGNWVFREWAPNATKIYLIGEFNNWKRTESSFAPNYQWPLLAQRMQPAHEQPPAASIQKVAIVHAHIIPYLRPDLK